MTDNNEMARWKAFEGWLEKYRARWSPACMFESTDIYLITVFIVLVAIAWLGSCAREAAGRLGWVVWLIILLLVPLYHIVDSMIMSTSISFVRGRPRHLLRSIVLAFLVFWNIAIAFAILYIAFGDSFDPPLSFPRALFFSIVTVTTLGDPVIKPMAGPAYILLALQLTIGLYFLAAILTTIVSWASDRGSS
jgi:hypothetical protein